jgi:hypothetical protein
MLLCSSICFAGNLQDIEKVLVRAVDVPLNGEAYRSAQSLLAHMNEYSRDTLNIEIDKLNAMGYYEQAFWKDNGRTKGDVH